MRYGKTILRDGNPTEVPPMREFEGYTRLEGVGDTYSNASPAQRSGHSSFTSWLPTDVAVDQDGKGVKLEGYINNVHPVLQEGLHDALKDLLFRFVPMFERVLGDLRNYTTDTVLGDAQSELDESKRPLSTKTGKHIEYWEDDEDDHNPSWDEWLSTAPYIDPKPGTYESGTRLLGTGYSLKGKKVQIIAKVAEM